ncbi:hypothetical protein GGR50DRAFT_33622 [Xylaria sp. CBS 124048]|nr:hypothetical protein GGR50DRAFT_33622 [Xylaria sp. CBS 124048]
MEDAQMAGSTAPSPAKGRGRGRGRKPLGKGVSKRKGKRGGRGGGPKVNTEPHVQAYVDRRKFLRGSFAEVAGIIRPVLDYLATQTIQKLIESPTAHEQYPAHRIVQGQLDDRLREVLSTADSELRIRTETATKEYGDRVEATHQAFNNGLNHATETFYETSFKRADIIAQLHRDGSDVNLPDSTHVYVEKSDDVLDQQGVWVEYRNGVEVPYPSVLERKAAKARAKAQPTKGRPSTKRKAEGLSDGLPNSKKSAVRSGSVRPENDDESAKPDNEDDSTKLDNEDESARPDNDDESATPQPRHIGGLLSAEAKLEGEPESTAASPSPESEPKTGTARRKKAPAIPDGASEPDEWGVRVLKKGRGNGRIIVRPLFTFDECEIGIRDAANKKAAGKSGDDSNSSNPVNFHVDRAIASYDCLTYEADALDPKLVEKHGLHPKYGIFLPGSRNDSEPPEPRVSGANSVVVVTPNGSTLHASRSARYHNNDAILREQATKDKLASLIARYCEEADILPEEIAVGEPHQREPEGQVAEEVPPLREDEDETESTVREDADLRAVNIDEPMATENMHLLLRATTYIESDRPNTSTSNQRSSRPYDAVRDVFTAKLPTPPPFLPMEVDTFGLSVLADVCGQVSSQREGHAAQQLDHRLEPQVSYRPDLQLGHHANSRLDYGPEYIPDRIPQHVGHQLDQPGVPLLGDSMIDPRLLGPPNPPPPSSNTFLQTALNPAPTFTHIAPAPPSGAELPTQTSVGRNPFTAPGPGKGSPVLPPLRPSRREKAMDTYPPPPVIVQHAPDFGAPLGMIQTNSGTFFPPAPARPYHQAYALPEQAHMMAMPYATVGNTTSSHPPHPLASAHRSSYQPPSPGMPNHTQIGAMPMHMPHGPPVSPPGLTMGLGSPTGPPGSRHRTSISSGSGGPGTGKYRRIAAAPSAHNGRPLWAGNSGTELRLAHYDHKESIKDYMAVEPPPRTGPTTIRGWNVNNVTKGRKGGRRDELDEKDTPR